MSIERADAKSRLWAFHQDGSVVGVHADTERAAARALREKSIPPVRLKSTPPIALSTLGAEEGDLVALGVIDETTRLLADYRTHDQSVVTLEDQTGSTWALRPNPRVVVNDEPQADR